MRLRDVLVLRYGSVVYANGWRGMGPQSIRGVQSEYGRHPEAEQLWCRCTRRRLPGTWVRLERSDRGLGRFGSGAIGVIRAKRGVENLRYQRGDLVGTGELRLFSCSWTSSRIDVREGSAHQRVTHA